MSNKETSKKKMEQIAKNLVEKNKSYNDIMSEFFQQNIDDISNIKEIKEEKDDQEETKKDKNYFPYLMDDKEKELIKSIGKNKLNDNQYKNINNNKPNDNLKFCTSVNKSITDYYYCFKKNNIRVNSSVDDENEKNNEL